MGGTNSHAVLDDVYHYLQTHNISANHCTVPSPHATGVVSKANGIDTIDTISLSHPLSIDPGTPKVFVWSAANKKSLIDGIASYASHFAELTKNQNPGYLENLAFTLNSRRSVLPWKSYVVANSIEQLSNLKDAASKPALSPTLQPNLAFVFTGQGAQWFGMGRELFAYPTFRDSILKSQDHLLELFCPWRLSGKKSFWVSKR